MISFWQRDPLWRTVLIGKSNLTIGRAGCTICSIADVSSYMGRTLSPVEVMQACLFTPDARILWDSCKFPSFVFEQRQRVRDDEEIIRAMKDPMRGVILEVARGSHWVAPSRWSLLQNCWVIKDPWYGDQDTMRRYADDITGAAFFRKT